MVLEGLSVTLVLAILLFAVEAEQTDIESVSVGTFNTFLFRGAPGFQERKDHFIQTLQSSRRISGAPDVLCLQEVFRRSDAKDIAEALRSQYPYHASFQDLDTVPSPQPACTPEEAGAAAMCLQQRCSQFDSRTALVNCTVAECGSVFVQFSQPCVSCLTTEVGAAEDGQADAFTRCASAIPRNEYTDAFGLLLLSHYPLSDVATTNYLDLAVTFFILRGYITARVQSIGHTIFCTHLTPINPGIDYGPLHGPPLFSSVDQQANEIKQIHAVVESTSSIILLGDFNHGPATPGLTWDVIPLNFGLMTSKGLVSVNALWCGQCTLCTDNILTEGSPNLLVDHIYLPTSRASNVIQVERLFASIRAQSGLPLSDHYGVRAFMYTRIGHSRTCSSSNVNDPSLDLDDIDSELDDSCPV